MDPKRQKRADQLKSECMKFELIANVSSPNIKMPLVSIISYVEFVKKEWLPKHVMDYVLILLFLQECHTFDKEKARFFISQHRKIA